ncbi:putative dynamin GTPase [Westerdykella ornata]|uniref:Putative dynamin GTPase n=1 Tax=Westerdykella ornata TaxID=318751 RepID=A0A6A6J9C9_WESOR|nr:putative dynamin GTPase [Westerdykella ornata]KAF2272877.1 putative dynamin GTPase [Westerdykella ornata]
MSRPSEPADSLFIADPLMAPTSIKRNSLTTTAFKALQTDDERSVLDIVDKLRRSGLNSTIELPQLVVCGDQSSGKSSVLEAITEIPFPRKENLCTRFATEIILRRTTESTILVRITPCKTRPEPEQETLRKFTAVLKDFKQLPELIDEASTAMGIGVKAAAGTKTRGRSAFARDVLSIEICGPDRTQLTLVDLPGLIQTTGKGQSAGDEKLVFELVREYMKNPRTIILAIVSAKNDWQNQVILEDCRKIDPDGERTIGIITKPDAVHKSDEPNWIDLAMNKHIYFQRGWHVLKNRGPGEMNTSFKERNEAEKDFFKSDTGFSALSPEFLGIEALRKRLSEVLLEHLTKELPLVKVEIQDKLKQTIAELDGLGERRSTIGEQRSVLVRMSLDIHNILKSAVIGYYDNPFFGPPDMNAGVDTRENIRRFRAVVQHRNKKFAETMRRQGHRYAIECGPGDCEADVKEAEKAKKELASMDRDDLGAKLPKPKQTTRPQAIDWVQKILERSRGSELPGNFNPTLIAQLFWDQSAPRNDIADLHIESVASVCKQFVHNVGKGKGIQQGRTGKAHKGQGPTPMTYNEHFTIDLQKQRQRKNARITQDAVKQAEASVVSASGGTTKQIDPVKLEEAFGRSIEQNMDRFSAEEALDNQQVYYKDERMYFINAVVKTVIERHLVEPLPDIILSPLVITQMTDKEVERVAAEAKETTARRNYLEQRKQMLEQGIETFRDAVCGLQRET